MTDTEKTTKAYKKLSKKDVFMSYVNWITFSLSCQNMERMMSPAFVRMMGRVADKLYDNEADKQAMMMRHTQFFNTEEVAGSIIPGIVLGMEEQKACGEDVPDEVIGSVKTALMGPLAGVGDSLLGGTLRPILLSIALGLAVGGSIVGPLFYCILWFGITSIGSWLLFNSGYKTGINAAEKMLSTAKDKVVGIANTVAMVVVGAISAQYVAVNSELAYTSGDMTITLLGTLDGIFPKLIPLLLTLMAWYLMDRKKLHIGWMFLIFIVIATAGTLLGIFVAP